MTPYAKFIVVFAIILSTNVAHADVVLTIDRPVLSATASGEVTFTGTLVNTGAADMFLNGISISALSSGVFISDGGFFINAPTILPAGSSYKGPLFGVKIDAEATLGNYKSTFTLLGGADSSAFHSLASQNFQLTVAPALPITSIALVPSPNSSGWNRSDVTVKLDSSENGPGSSRIKSITFSATGAQAITTTNVAADSTSVVINNEGITTIRVFATDESGNSESLKTVTVQIDKTAPMIVSSRLPAPNMNGWNNGDVTASFTCSDNLSGLALGSPPPPVVVSAEGTAQSVNGICKDLAENVAITTVKPINIDKTPPVLTAEVNPQPNANGWNNTQTTIVFSATDALSGVASVSSPVTIQSEGKAQNVAGSATDLADNLSSLSVAVNLDKTPPEAFNQFDPTSRDVVLFGRDSLSGVAPGPITPTSVALVRHGDEEDEDEGNDRQTIELRTYNVFDLAGNVLILKEKVRKSEESISVQIISLQYNKGPVLAVSHNSESFKWEFQRNGGLSELEQKFKLVTGHRGEDEDQELTARFSAKRGETVIRRESDPAFKTVKAGLVLLRMATYKGKLVFEF